MRVASLSICIFFFFNDTATTEIYTLSLHDALPIFARGDLPRCLAMAACMAAYQATYFTAVTMTGIVLAALISIRSEEHTSELQSRLHLVCRLLLEKKKKKQTYRVYTLHM